ncbi:MAG: PilW family protein [Opitutales bacterium]
MMETMVAAGLAAFVLLGILQTFLFIGKTSYNASNYCVMEEQSRRAMETFGEEVRQASAITWNSSSSVTLTVPTSSGNITVNYIYDSSTSGSTAQCFYRQVGSGTPLILVRNVTAFAFERYELVIGTGSNIASNDLSTKQLQMTLQTTMKGVTAAAATNAVLSARYILRNKSVSS